MEGETRQREGWTLHSGIPFSFSGRGQSPLPAVTSPFWTICSLKEMSIFERVSGNVCFPENLLTGKWIYNNVCKTKTSTVCWKMKTYAWRQECRDTFYCSTVIGTRVSLSWVCRDAFKMRLNRREEGAFCEGEHYNAAAQTASIPLQLTCVCILSHCTGLEQRFCIIS